jgi:hypothetical protein
MLSKTSFISGSFSEASVYSKAKLMLSRILEVLSGGLVAGAALLIIDKDYLIPGPKSIFNGFYPGKSSPRNSETLLFVGAAGFPR